MAKAVCIKKCFANKRLYVQGEVVNFVPGLPKEHFRILDGSRQTEEKAKEEIEQVKKEEQKTVRSPVQEERIKKARAQKAAKKDDLLK